MRVLCAKLARMKHRPFQLPAASLLSVALAVMLLPGATLAADTPTLDKGLTELGGGLNLNWTEGANSQQISPIFGGFLGPGAEIEVRPIIARSQFDSLSTWDLWLLGSFYYNFNTNSSVVPFLGGGGGFLSVGGTGYFESDTRPVASAGGGLKVFLTDWAFMRVEYLMRNVFYEYDDVQMHDIVLGFGLMLGEGSQ